MQRVYQRHCCLFFIMFGLKKLLNEPIVDLKYLLVSLIFVCFIAVIANFSVNALIVRYLICVLMTAMLVFYFWKQGLLDGFIKE